MDARGRGGADEIDPADQWVLNPSTGNYELRLDGSPPQPPASRPGRSTRAAPTSAVPPRAARRPVRTAPGVPGPRRNGGAPPPGGRHGAHKRPGRSRKKKALLITGGSLAFVLVAGSVGGYLYYRHLNANIATTDVLGAGSDGLKNGQALNILVIGTDKRTGAGNEGYGDKNSSGHADTTILLHISKDRTNATALSIPRDLVTDIPECPTKQADGSTKTIPGQSKVRFNTSLGQSGRDPGCTMRTVRKLTGIPVDHFMMADFNAVKTLSTAVGGVPICLKKDIDDKNSHLKLSKGEHRLEGEQALAFVRTRHAYSNQSDLDRIKAQQVFLSSMIREMQSSETLTSPTKLFSLAEAATKALTVDTGLGGIPQLVRLGKELKDLDPKNITFTTLPVDDNPAEKVKATVVLKQPQAEQLLAMIRADTSLTDVNKRKEEAQNAQQQAPPPATRAPASDIRVEIYNGGAPAGSAQSTMAWLKNTRGVPGSSNKGNAATKVEKTLLEYAPAQADQARTLADTMGLPPTALKQGTEDAAAPTPMKLTLGADFKGAGTPIGAPQKAPEGIQRLEADQSTCAG